MTSIDEFLDLDNASELFSTDQPTDDLYRQLINNTDMPVIPETTEPLFNFADLFAAYPPTQTSLFLPTPPSSVGIASPEVPFTIDPQLVATPVTLTATSPVSPSIDAPLHSKNTPSSIINDDDEDDSQDEDDGLPRSKGSSKKLSSVVATGGIVKRTGATSCVVRDPDSNDPEDWRPTAEEYKKLSSKEKRQLRNKISARNFRVRRKEYITQLESHISDRDRLIDAIRQELGQSKLENAELRKEIDALKKAMLEGKAHPTGLPPPATTASSTTSVTKRRTAPLTTANVNKDIPNSPAAAAARSFWGGAAMGLGTGGITPVHATLVPDMSMSASVASLLNGKLTSRQENINPFMNLTPSTPPDSPPQNHASTPNIHQALDDINPFTIKTLDAYRLQLWSKMAAAGHLPPRADPSQPSSHPLFNSYQPSGLSGQLRPAFFTNSSSPSSPPKTTSSPLSAVLSGKLSAGAAYYPSSAENDHPSRTPQEAALIAAVASRSLVSKMSSAFWDAFANTSTSSSTPSTKSLDTDKILKVLEGTAVVRVVDVEEPLSKKTVSSSNSLSRLEAQMSSLNLGSKSTPREEPLPLSSCCSVLGQAKRSS